MGLLSALAGLPLAPLKALVAVARQVGQQAQEERSQELDRLQAELLELPSSDEGAEEARAKEDELLERLGLLVGAASGGEDE
jgi:hypothetical protein